MILLKFERIFQNFSSNCGKVRIYCGKVRIFKIMKFWNLKTHNKMKSLWIKLNRQRILLRDQKAYLQVMKTFYLLKPLLVVGLQIWMECIQKTEDRTLLSLSIWITKSIAYWPLYHRSGNLFQFESCQLALKCSFHFWL